MGHANETNRYDYAIIFIKEFFGKSLVVSLQSGTSTVMCAEDALHLDHLQKIFRVDDRKEAEQLSVFFQHHLPTLSMETEY
jgi:hypothetical protein